MSWVVQLILMVIVAAVVVIVLPPRIPLIESALGSILQQVQNPIPLTTYIPQTTNFSNSNGTSHITVPHINQSQLAEYALQLINRDRAQYGLANVTLSSEPSGQQHAESMLHFGYFSHWDLLDMKPYMRYTLLGGNESVSENIAYETSKVCGVLGCTGTIDPNDSLQKMEYSMMYNDSACCNNGHRDNILDPNHNQVSIGVAYNNTAIYFTEDFIDNYIRWSRGLPSYAGKGETYLGGTLAPGYSLYQIYVSYDPSVHNLTVAELPGGSYGYGEDIAGVVGSYVYYYNTIATIVADKYVANGNQFNVQFNMSKQVRQYGAGEYTIEVVLNNTAKQQSFIASTYTVFINSTGQQYIPKYV